MNIVAIHVDEQFNSNLKNAPINTSKLQYLNTYGICILNLTTCKQFKTHYSKIICCILLVLKNFYTYCEKTPIYFYFIRYYISRKIILLEKFGSYLDKMNI